MADTATTHRIERALLDIDCLQPEGTLIEPIVNLALATAAEVRVVLASVGRVSVHGWISLDDLARATLTARLANA